MKAETPGRITGGRLKPLAVGCLLAALGAAQAIGGGQAHAGEAARTVTVVELFTSQGCSSCPPADQTLANLAADPSVIALTFPVDYWDYLGWRDTFARPDFSKRQKGYAKVRGDNEVYTPQAVINGSVAVIGSDEHKVRGAIETARRSGHGPSVPISARVEGDKVIVEVPAGAPLPGQRTSLWIAAFREPTTVSIDKGENTGRTVTYTNVVERWQVLGIWDGTAMRVELPLADIAQDGTAGCAVILQAKKHDKPSRILGAAKIDLLSN